MKPSRGRLLLMMMAACSLLEACAFGLSTGAANTSGNAFRERAYTTSMTFTTHAFRQGRPVFGVRLSTAVDHGFAIRNGLLHTGYDFRLIPGYLVLVPAIELGAGQPAAQDLGGFGSYFGVATTLRERLSGVNDAEPAFNVYALNIDLFIGARVGGWMRPETSSASSRAVVWEGSIELGIRFAVGSDVITSAQGENAEPDGSEEEESR